MQDFKEDILKLLKDKRPNLSANSCRSYVSTLANLPKKCDLPDTTSSLLHNTSHILQCLKDVEPHKRRSIMSALFVITECPQIKEQMDSDMKITNANYRQQKKSATEKENWLDWDAILAKYNELKNEALAIFKLKTISPDQLFTLSKFVLLCLYVLMPPRRVLDYSLLKWGKTKNADTNFNYITKDQIIFNQYKTVKTYHQQVFSLPMELQQILKKWRTYNKGEYVITNKSGDDDGFTSNGITKILNSIFAPDKISCDLLRHAFITSFLNSNPPLSECDAMAEKMAHSQAQQTLYKKVD